MLPRLLDFGGPWVLSTYGVLVALGFLLGLRVAVLLARRSAPPLPADAVVDAAVYSLLVGLLGAKALYVLLDLRAYLEEPRLLIATLRYAGVFYGGLLAAVLFLVLFARRRGVPLLGLLDVLAPAAAVAHAVGRIGCFAAGCCWGRACDLPWAVVFRSEAAHETTGVPLGVPLHPVQAYEAAANLAVFALLLALFRRPGRRPGEVLCVYLVLYAAARFALETLRDDPRGPVAGGLLSVSQGIALAVAALGGIALVLLRRRGAPPPGAPGPA